MKITKTLIAASAVIASLFISGCDKDLPTPEKINSVAIVVGRTAGYACDLAKMDKTVKENVVAVLDVVSSVVPTNGQTFVEVWVPMADNEIKKLIDAGKLNDAGALATTVAIRVASEGIDYVFVKYPKAKDVEELVAAAVDGFVKGFKRTTSFAADAKNIDIDNDAYNYLKAKMGK